MSESTQRTDGDLNAPVTEAGSATTETEGPTLESLQAEVARLTQEAERNWQQFLRAAADLENYRKQAVRQREDAVAMTRRSMLMVILGVMDTLERAIAHAGAAAGEGQAAAIADGIRMAHRQVLERLATLGVRPIESTGQPFDPRVHEAVDTAPAGEQAPAGTVVGEIQRGYFVGDEVLRPARVRVAQ
jgi:molecular chaperone GrpE